MEVQGDIFSPSYFAMKSRIEGLEREIADWTETIDYSEGDERLVLPTNIWETACNNNIQKVLNWLGSLPVDKQRLDARDPEAMETGLVNCAVMGKNCDLLSILLQLGADKDQLDGDGTTPLVAAGIRSEFNAQVRLLLEWGADFLKSLRTSKDCFIKIALRNENNALANL